MDRTQNGDRLIFKGIPDTYERSGYTDTDTRVEAYYLEDVLTEIEYDITYLEDAPDEMLTLYDDRFDDICERLKKLDEYLHNVRNKVIVQM
jgi:hypothetical protein